MSSLASLNSHGSMGANPKRIVGGGGGGVGDSDTFFSERHLRRKSHKSQSVGVPILHHKLF